MQRWVHEAQNSVPQESFAGRGLVEFAGATDIVDVAGFVG